MTGELSITLDQLVVLETIDRVGTFSGAARELNRVTSAISYTVRTLEEALGVMLFDRSGHSASLTSDGERMLHEARQVLDAARHMRHVGQEIRKGWESELKLVVDGAYPTKPVMQALRQFNEQDLPTRILLRTEYLSGVDWRFHEQQAQLMLTLDYDGQPNMKVTTLPPLKMALVAHASHPLAQEKKVDRAKLAQHMELVVDDSSPKYEGLPDNIFLGSPHVFHLSDFHSKREALLNGVGYGWLARHLADPLITEGTLVVLPFAEGSEHTFHPQLVQRRDRPLGRAGLLFVEFLLKEIQQTQL